MFTMQNRPSKKTSGAGGSSQTGDQFAVDLEEFRILDQCLCLLQLSGRIDRHPCDPLETGISLPGLPGKGT